MSLTTFSQNFVTVLSHFSKRPPVLLKMFPNFLRNFIIIIIIIIIITYNLKFR